MGATGIGPCVCEPVTLHLSKTMLKNTLFVLYVAMLIVMAVATFVEPVKGSGYVSADIYGSWWFALMWAALAVTGAAYLFKSHIRRVTTITLHASFVVILLGALLTHVSSRQGTIHLRLGQPSQSYIVDEDRGGGEERSLPFELTLNSFDILYHEGTASVADYVSTLTINDGGRETVERVSMNKIVSRRSIRLCQMSYDTDMQGTRLSVNADPYGIPVTYTGYALLFLSLVAMLIDPRGGFRRALRQLGARAAAVVVMTAVPLFASGAPHVLPKETAAAFGRLNVVYNGRVQPVQTLAIDYVRKVHGSKSYHGYTAEQVFTGCIFWPDEWSKEPLMHIARGPLRETLQLPDDVSPEIFFNRDMGGYILGPYVREYYQGRQDKFHRQAADIDDRLQLVLDLRRGALLKLFPYVGRDGSRPVQWFSPVSELPEDMEPDRKQYIRDILNIMSESARRGDFTTCDDAISRLYKYQQTFGGTSVPAPAAVRAERLNNAVPFATILFIVNLTAGLLSLLWFIIGGTYTWSGTGRATSMTRPTVSRPAYILLYIVACLSFLSLTLCLVLRWIISGYVPMSNGYETMLLTAWLVLLVALIVCHRLRIVLAFGLLLSGFFLLVSHINLMNPQITHIMPVLSSPLLCVHVSLIMMSFALLSLTFICSVTALVRPLAARLSVTGRQSAPSHRTGQSSDSDGLRVLSDLFLYPALTLLGIGIFIGAIWANVSWGTYWSWDPKEVWALITFMVYAVAVHTRTIAPLRRPMTYHAFMALAFLTVVMTYFGVNYFLGGMHSYA